MLGINVGGPVGILTHIPGSQRYIQLLSLLLQYSPSAQFTPPSKLQQEGGFDGDVLGINVGSTVGTISCTHSPGRQSSIQFFLLLLQNSPPPHDSPPSKLQQEGVSDGVELVSIVGEGVGCFWITHLPGEQSDSQLLLLLLQKSPPPQFLPSSKLQQKEFEKGVELGANEGAAVGVDDGPMLGLKDFVEDGVIEGVELGVNEGAAVGVGDGPILGLEDFVDGTGDGTFVGMLEGILVGFFKVIHLPGKHDSSQVSIKLLQ